MVIHFFFSDCFANISLFGLKFFGFLLQLDFFFFFLNVVSAKTGHQFPRTVVRKKCHYHLKYILILIIFSQKSSSTVCSGEGERDDEGDDDERDGDAERDGEGEGEKNDGLCLKNVFLNLPMKIHLSSIYLQSFTAAQFTHSQQIAFIVWKLKFPRYFFLRVQVCPLHTGSLGGE